MVSRRHQASVAIRLNWVTVEPSRAIGVIWCAVFIVAVALTAQTTIYILQNGFVADRPPLSAMQTLLRIVLLLGSVGFAFLRGDGLERLTLMAGAIAAASSTLFGFGARSPLLAAVRVGSHFTLYLLAAVVAWRVVVATRRQMAAETIIP